MARRSASLFVACTVAALATAQQVGYILEGPDTGRVEVAGVCDVTADTVRCWTPTGEAAPEVAERVKAYYLVNSNNLNLRFGMKNRHLVVYTDNAGGNRWSSNFSVDGVDYLNMGGSLSQGPRTISWYTFAVPNDRKTVIPKDTLTRMMSPSISLKLEPGSEAKDEHGTFRVVKVAPGMRANRGGYYPWGGVDGVAKAKAWTITIAGPSALPLASTYTFTYPKGGAFQYVNLSGVPVIVKPQEMSEVYRQGSKIRPISIGPDQFFSEGRFDLITNVDPARVSRLLISFQESKVVTFPEVVLDPRNETYLKR